MRSVPGASMLVVPAAAAVLGGCVAEPTYGGLLPVRNNHPAQLLIQHLPVTTARALPAGAARYRLSAAYSSLFLNGSNASGSFYMDGEYLRVRPAVEVGVGHGVEVGFEVPFAHASGGFLDAFVIDYHDTLGFPDQGREAAPRNAFEVAATANGQSVFAVEPDGLELLDVPLHASWCVTEPGDRLAVALRAGVELPTGSRSRGYGNGEPDWSIGALAEYDFGDVCGYAHLQHTFAGSPDMPAGTSFRFADVTAAGVGLELPLWPELNALVQVEFETSTLRSIDVGVAKREQVLLWVGGRYRLDEHWGIEASFGEDLRGKASPDFTAWLGCVAMW